jgi:hypothetical protein
MRHIDESRLESDLGYRFEYLTDFMNFTTDDIQAIQTTASWLGGLVPHLVDAVYEKLFQYDATKRHFMPRQSGYEGTVPTDLNDVTHTHAMIQFRKQHLGRYLVALVTKPFDTKMVTYLDMVGKMHTPLAGSKELDVPLVQMNALLGFVSDAILATISSAALDRETEIRTMRAFNKLLWLQNDLIVRHYQNLPKRPGKENPALA